MAQAQMTLIDESIHHGESRRLLSAMITPVLRINELAMSSPEQWESPIYGPSVHEDASRQSHASMGYHRGQLKALRDEYWRLTQ